MVATRSPEATTGGAGEGAGATWAPRANPHLQSAKINRHCWLHLKHHLGSSLVRRRPTRRRPCQDPAACSPSWKTGVQHRQRWGPRAPPQNCHCTGGIIGKSLGHDGKARGKNYCRQIGLMQTGTLKHFSSSFRGLDSSNRYRYFFF